MAGTGKYDPFGFKFYMPPKTTNMDDKITGFSPAKGKFVGCFFPIEQKAMGYTAVPAPKYVGHDDWNE